MTKIIEPLGLKKVAWTPNYMNNGIVRTRPTDKVFGITVFNVDHGLSKHEDFGVTHYQTAINAGVNFDREWTNFRAEFDVTPTQFANRFSVINENLDKRHIYAGQLQEDGFTPEEAIEAFGRVYDKLAANDGSITSPKDTWVIGDYFQPLPGGNLAKCYSVNSLYAAHKAALADQTSCRSGFNFGENNFTNPAIPYYTSIWGYNKQNGIIPNNYLSSWVENRGSVTCYQVIFDIIKSRGGAPNRRLVSFDWSSYDGASWNDSGIRVKRGLVYSSPDGILYRNPEVHPIPYEIMKQRTFFNILLGDGSILWEVNFQYTNQLNKWMNVGMNDDNISWKPDGGSEVTFNGSTPSPRNSHNPVLRDYPLGISENGAAAAFYLYTTLKDLGLLGSYVEWIPFTYSVDGGASQNGYKLSQNPVNGNNGNTVLSSINNPNYGESNVIDSFEAQKPLVGLMVGDSGHSFFGVNPFADIDQETVITLPTFGGIQLVLDGDELSVFTGTGIITTTSISTSSTTSTSTSTSTSTTTLYTGEELEGSIIIT